MLGALTKSRAVRHVVRRPCEFAVGRDLLIQYGPGYRGTGAFQRRWQDVGDELDLRGRASVELADAGRCSESRCPHRLYRGNGVGKTGLRSSPVGGVFTVAADSVTS